jgi:hypothetical protein
LAGQSCAASADEDKGQSPHILVDLNRLGHWHTTRDPPRRSPTDRGDALQSVIFEIASNATLGEGGIERRNCYPIVLWLVAFGTYLMSGPTAGDSPRSKSVFRLHHDNRRH